MTIYREPVVVTSQGGRLFGVLDRPLEDTSAMGPGVLILHGFLGSKDQPHRMLVDLATALAQAGLVALRIDLPGRGDSQGESVDITVDGDLAAARAALDYLAALPGVDAQQLAVLGFSWGGVLGAHLAGESRRVRATVFWSSIPTERLVWRPEMTEVNGREVAEQWAMLVGRQFYDGMDQLRPLASLLQTTGAVLAIYGTADEIQSEEIAAFQHALLEGRIPHEIVAIEGADHIFFRYAWKREVIERTVAWLAGILPSI
ncbi:MAG: alpha/beta fold hydrolase [Anaerolineae bacterium]|nr:alpha/beta fold hydrolase [Anaerolineae bacterium]